MGSLLRVSLLHSIPGALLLGGTSHAARRSRGRLVFHPARAVLLACGQTHGVTESTQPPPTPLQTVQMRTSEHSAGLTLQQEKQPARTEALYGLATEGDTGREKKKAHRTERGLFASGGSRHILPGGPRRGQCLTRGAQKKAKKLYLKIIKFILFSNRQTFNLYKSL